jgi:signal transduction histidine kinase
MHRLSAKRPEAFFAQWLRAPVVKYVLAILVTVAALLVRRVLEPWLGDTAIFVTIFPALAFSALYLGIGPAVSSVVVGLAGENYLIQTPNRPTGLTSFDYAASLAYAVAAAALIIALAETSRRSYRRLQKVEAALRDREAELQKSQCDLEKKIAERTQELSESVDRLESEIRIRKEAEEHLRSLSAQVIRLQNGERRRIAREMHDGVAQSIIAMKMKLESFDALVADIPKATDLLCELKAFADQAIGEIRAVTYLLHPPLLTDVGFSAAAKNYLDGLSKRSGMRIKLELSPLRLRKDAEVVFFRVLQEGLSNVLRHSGSDTVDVRLDSDDGNVILSIRDYGKGIPFEKLHNLQKTGAEAGVGLAGMRERVEEMGGGFTIDSDSGGTRVTARLPRVLAEWPTGEGGLERARGAAGA